MHRRLLDMLRCPQTGAPLSLRAGETRSSGFVVSGELTARTGTRYPIVGGVPRFAGADGYASSFGFEWNRWPRVQFEAENVGRPMAGHTTRMWERITRADGDLRGRAIVEFGCGAGRFLDVVRRKGGTAVGLELSAAAQAARANLGEDPDVLVVQGDLLNPPLRDAAFDGGYSIGVLHHTPDPARGLERLARSIRAGGWVACSVYPKGEFYDDRCVRRTRRLHRRLKPLLGYRFALAYSYASAYLWAPLSARARAIPGLGRTLDYIERNWLVTLALPDRRWRALDVFDAITPEIASTHTGEEVKRWFASAGCTGVRAGDWGETSVTAIREGPG
jgi:SAM-dependent methyltransferase/uncharacterized protein YbaR (Trm112 family)